MTKISVTREDEGIWKESLENYWNHKNCSPQQHNKRVIPNFWKYNNIQSSQFSTKKFQGKYKYEDYGLLPAKKKGRKKNKMTKSIFEKAQIL